jgi:DNA-binding NarL/FixJ family response regulator
MDRINFGYPFLQQNSLTEQNTQKDALAQEALEQGCSVSIGLQPQDLIDPDERLRGMGSQIREIWHAERNSLSTSSILIVKEDETAAGNLALDLKCAGYNVVGIVHCGEQAIQKTGETQPDLVLMDIVLKGTMDGILASAKIRETYNIPVVYVTSCTDRETLKRAKETQPRGYLIEPYQTDDLKATVESALQKQANPIDTFVQKTLRKTKIGSYKLKEFARQSLNLPSLTHQARQQQREQYRKQLPPLSSKDLEVVRALQEEGTFITSIEKLGISNTTAFLKSIQTVFPELQTIPNHGDWSVRLPWRRKVQYPDILFWALAERLLDIVETYIGLPLLYHGADVRRDAANSPLTGPQQWHRDIDDDRMVKLIVYLNDVDPEGGAFEYIPRSQTAELTQALNYTSGYIADQVIANIISPEHWKPCLGATGTVVIVDPIHVFHRAKPVTARDRFSITFGFTSRKPKVNLNEFKLPADQWEDYTSRLTPRQIACLPKIPG